MHPSYTHVFDLVMQLRQVAIESQASALDRDDGGYLLCLEASLANDAADALQALLAQRAIGAPSHVAMSEGDVTSFA